MYRLGGDPGAELQRSLFEVATKEKPFKFGGAVLFQDNAFKWLAD